MLLFHRRSDLHTYLLSERANGSSIGFVPTMGALHEGHISLIQKSKEQNTVTVCSIFVNPTQFNDANDLAKYPRTTESDIAMLIAAGCEVLYLPEAQDVYGETVRVSDQFDFGGLDSILEGASRPGHFAGVAQVVKILLEIINPDRLYMGQKDYQQWLIVSKMVALLQLPVQVVRCSIFRESNGLAMSSRNVRLSAHAREMAGIIYATLQWAADALANITIPEIEAKAIEKLDSHTDFKTDYFKILDASSLLAVREYTEQKSVVIVTAVVVEGVRLLDNLVKEPS